MKIDLNKTVSTLILIIGHGFFFLNIADHFAFAFISIICMFLIWIIWNKTTGTFQLHKLLTLIALSGLITSIGIFALFGVEPIGTRKGTLIHFHATGIAIALGIFFVTLLPYIIFNLKFNLPKPFNVTLVSGFKKQTPSKKQSQKDKYIVGDQEWEMASESDINSGNYNIE